MRFLKLGSAIVYFFVLLTSCSIRRIVSFPARQSVVTGTAFYKQAFPYNWQQRDSLVWQQVSHGNIPSFLTRFVPIPVSIYDTAEQRTIKAIYYVSPDYFSVGTDDDWARVNITPMMAQRIADSLHCFLPTKKMVDDIYKNADVKLEPVPMYAFRDSTPTMFHHHLIVEGQRKGRKGLIAGIMKDVVISSKIVRDPKPNRVAIYGWHLPGGKPIQPLYTGHVNWYVDYSHGTRLVYEKIKVNGKWMDYKDVLSDAVLKRLLCDEDDCSFFRYPY
ncbi:MAG: hypothetical protein ACO1OO_00190 [Flavisolibacter sp.]